MWVTPSTNKRPKINTFLIELDLRIGKSVFKLSLRVFKVESTKLRCGGPLLFVILSTSSLKTWIYSTLGGDINLHSKIGKVRQCQCVPSLELLQTSNR